MNSVCTVIRNLIPGCVFIMIVLSGELLIFLGGDSSHQIDILLYPMTYYCISMITVLESREGFFLPLTSQIQIQHFERHGAGSL